MLPSSCSRAGFDHLDSTGERSWRVIERELESRWNQPEPEPSRRSMPEETTKTHDNQPPVSDLDQDLCSLFCTPPRSGRAASLTEMRRLLFGELTGGFTFTPKSAIKSAS